MKQFGQIIHLHDSRWREPQTLVLADLHERTAFCGGKPEQFVSALRNCRAALAHARANGIQVAFVRHVPELRLFGAEDQCAPWISGFTPLRSEMIFDRDLPSCYASQGFSDLMNCRKSQFVLAGLFAESVCLSTAIDAFHRNHKVTYLADACASQALGEISEADVHRVVSGIIGLYGHIIETGTWIQSTTPKYRTAIEKHGGEKTK